MSAMPEAASSDKYERIRELFGVFAPDYDAHMRRTRHYEVQADLLARFSGRLGGEVCDLACGPGSNARILLGMRPCSVTGVDFQPEMLVQARALLGGEARLVQADAHALPFADQSFDGVTCAYGFFWFRDPARVAGEIRRVLRPNGAAVVLEERFFSGALPQPAFAKNGGFLSELASLENFMHLTDVQAVFAAAGFGLADQAASVIDDDHELVASVFLAGARA